MMSMLQRGLAEVVADVEGDLSPTERRVAAYYIEAGPRAAAMSAREVAGAVGASDATVIRTARALGYANLRELRQAAAEDPEPSLAGRLAHTLAGTAGPYDVLVGAVRSQAECLDALLRHIDADQFDLATSILAGASRVVMAGTGPSGHLAAYAAFLARRLGRPSVTLTGTGVDHADELLELRPGDAVVVLAYGRVHPHVRTLIKRADELAVPVLLVTDAGGGRRSIGSISCVLAAGRGPASLFASHGPTIVLLEALVLAVARTDAGRAERSLADLNELRTALTGRRVDVDPA
jgi:DNA-binding MurR/RpiR family transcriptional regulator